MSVSEELLGIVRRRVAERAHEHQLHSIAGLIAEHAELRVVLVPTDDEAEAIGRVGGAPLLPVGMEWPTGETGPLVAWLQVELERLPFAGGPWPSAGRLLFFLAPEPRDHRRGDRLEADAGRVIVVAPGVEVVEVPPPEGVTVLPARSLRAVLETSLPSSGSVFLRQELRRLEVLEESLWEREHELDDDELPPDEGVTERYDALRDALRRAPLASGATGAERWRGPDDVSVAELGGHTSPCQEDPLLELVIRQLDAPPSYPLSDAAFGALEERARGWRLLAQARSNPPLGYDFLTGGWLYFLVPVEASAAGRLDGVQTVAQR